MLCSHTQTTAAGVDLDRYQQPELAVWEEIEFEKVSQKGLQGAEGSVCGQLAKEGLGSGWRGGCQEEQWGVGVQWEPGLCRARWDNQD